MVRLRSIDVLSCAKIYGIIHVAIGILIGLFLVVIGMIGLAAAPGQQKYGMIGMFFFAAMSPFVYGAIGFVVGALMALFYNWVAAAIGGVKIELEAVPMPYGMPPVPPPAVAE